MKLFGPPLKESWHQLAASINADFDAGSFTKSPRVVLEYKHWVITLDTYTVSTGKSSVTYTRMRMPYRRDNNVRFKLSRKNIFSGIGSLFGDPVIETYDYTFDDEFIIKGDDETVIKEIFQNDDIKQKIIAQRHLLLKMGPYKDKKSVTDGELYFQRGTVIKDPDILKNLFSLFTVLIDEMVRTGVAADEKPVIRL